MPNSRKQGKTFKGAWLEDSKIEELKRICAAMGVDFTEFLRGIADGDYVLVKKDKTNQGDNQ